MKISSTLSAVIAAATIAGTGTLVYAQTVTHPAVIAPGATTPSTALPADAAGHPAMPAEVTRPIPPAATLQANDAATTSAPGYSAGTTSTYQSNSSAPADASAVPATPTPVPATTSRMSEPSPAPSSTMPMAVERAAPRADRN